MIHELSIAIVPPPQRQPEKSAQPMDVDIVSSVDHLQWDNLLSEEPHSTFFHTLEWSDTLERALSGWSRFFIVGTVDGRVVAGLPAMKYSKRGFYAIMSMPFGTHGGPLVGDAAPQMAGEDLSQRFFDEATSTKRVAYAELVDLPSRVNPSAESGIRSIEDETQVLELGLDYDELYGGFKPANRNKIRKAQKAGVTVRQGRRRDDFLRYNSILLDCSKNWGGRVRFGEKFFDALSEIDNGSVQLWLAEYNKTAVAGLLNFAHNGMVMNWGAVMMHDSRSLSPMNLLHSEAIRDAVDNGFSKYSFGSSAGFKGVDKFKTTFGTTRATYYHHVLQKKWFSVLKRWSRRRRS
ncbi:MAG: GNAT family N-acetyltransferase [Candidatus Krumholzibacteria bacterium]|nr:GNAT family N-acetyltransferase [Candidatus Krumholzibacteria bacterium]